MDSPIQTNNQIFWSNLNTDHLKTIFLSLHIVWAFIGAGICILLANLEGGHPPGLVFVPIAAAIWLVGHVLFWLSRKLLVRGKYLVENKNITGKRWLLILIVLVILFGFIFILGIVGLASFFI